MGRLLENCVVNIKDKSWSVTADVEVLAKAAEGVIVHQGGKFGGWSLYAKAGKVKFAYNLFGLKLFTTVAANPISAGKHQVRMDFKYDGGGLGKGGNVTLYYDGQKAGEGRVDATVPMCFSADEGLDIGHESGTNVTPDYTTQESEFNGKIHLLRIDLGEDSHEHLITPEDRHRIAMTRQ